MFQEDKDMADQNEAKTKTIGFLPIEKVQTLNGWDEYADKSTKLSVLRTETQKAKNSVRVCPKTSGGITKFSEHEAD